MDITILTLYRGQLSCTSTNNVLFHAHEELRQAPVKSRPCTGFKASKALLERQKLKFEIRPFRGPEL
jgi:hypothetical protein